jgi:hypothetical protein
VLKCGCSSVIIVQCRTGTLFGCVIVCVSFTERVSPHMRLSRSRLRSVPHDGASGAPGMPLVWPPVSLFRAEVRLPRWPPIGPVHGVADDVAVGKVNLVAALCHREPVMITVGCAMHPSHFMITPLRRIASWQTGHCDHWLPPGTPTDRSSARQRRRAG